MDKATKAKVLQAAISKLKKSHGEDVLLDTTKPVEYEVIPSGSLLFDQATGIGGIPMAKITEIFGENSVGKCLTKDTYIDTPQGVLTIEEIFRLNGEEPLTTTKEKEISYPLYNEKGEVEDTTHFTWNGERKILKVTTQSGNEIKITFNHPLRVLTESGIVWVEGKDLKIGDYLVLPRKNLDLKLSEPVEDLEAELLGYLIADGTISYSGKVSLSNTDPCVVARYKEITSKIFNKEPLIYPNNTMDVSCKELVEPFYNRFDITEFPCLARDKRIPLSIRTGSFNSRREFIRAYAELEANISSRHIEIVSASKELLKQFKYILQADYDILSTLKPKLVQLDTWEEPREFHRLTITGGSYLSYLAYIGFRTKGNLEALKETCEIKDSPTYYDPIVSIEELDPEPTFDFSMSSTASFIANGIASHNTSWAYSLCSQAQKKYPDRMVLYVDIEAAVSLDYMQQFGVDTSPEKFMIASPNSAEEAFDIMETMVDTGLFSLVIYDSVGASLTTDQIEKGISQNTMASLAKRMSVGCNKMKNSAKEANTAVVFINQVYSSMSLYGNSTTTKGGKALPYTASLRIQLSKRDLINSDEDKEDIIGQVLKFKFVKNKVGKPYQEGETVLYFGKGFDQIYEIVDLAVQYGIIQKGGAWFNFEVPEKKGSKKMVPMKFQGKDKVLEYLRNDPMGFEYIKGLVTDRFSTAKVIDENGY